MANDQNLKPWKPGQSGNPGGKPKGTKNRSTIVREILEMERNFPDETWEKIRKLYPKLSKDMTAEQLITLQQVEKAITNRDTAAYIALLDSCYGKAGTATPTQESEPFEGEITKDLIAREIMKVAMITQDPTEKLKALDLLMKHTAGYVTARDIVNALSEQEREELILQLSTKLVNNEK